MTARIENWNPCRQPRANQYRLYISNWQPTHPDHIQAAETQAISVVVIYVKVTNSAIKQAWLDEIKIGQYDLIEGSE